MPKNYQLEVDINYTKATNSMKGFRAKLLEQIASLEKQKASFDKTNSTIEKTVDEFNDATKALAKTKSAMKKIANETSKLNSEVKSLAKDFSKATFVSLQYAEKLERLNSVESKLIVTGKQRKAIIAQLNKAQTLGYESIEKMSTAEQSLWKHFTKGSSALEKYSVSLKKITEARALNIIDSKREADEIKKLNDAYALNGRTVKENSAAKEKARQTVHNLNMEYKAGYSAQQAYNKSSSKLTQALMENVISGKSFVRQMKLADDQLKRGGQTHAELRKAQLATAKANRALRLEFDLSAKNIMKNRKEILFLRNALNKGSITSSEFKQRIAELGISFKDLAKQEKEAAKASMEFQKTMHNLRLEFVSGYKEQTAYQEKLTRMRNAVRNGVISLSEFRNNLRAMNKELKFNGQTVTDLTKANLRLSESTHNLNMEYNKGYASQQRYNQELLKLQKAIALGAIGSDEYFRRLSALNKAYAHGGKTVKEYTDYQDKAKLVIQGLNAEFSKGYSAQQKYNEATARLAQSMMSGITSGKSFLRQLQLLNEQLKRGGTTHAELRQKQLETAKANRELKKSYDATYTTILSFREANVKLVLSLANIKREYNSGVIGLKEYKQKTKEVELALKSNKLALQDALNGTKSLTQAQKEQSMALSELKSKHDVIYAAKQKYKQQEQELKTLVDNNVISQKRMNDILARYKSQLAEVIVKERASLDSKQKKKNALTELRMKYDNVFAAQQHYKKAVKDIERLEKKGLISTQRMNELLKIQSRRLKEASGAATGFINRFKAMTAAVNNFTKASKIASFYVKALHVAWKGFFTIMAVQTFGRWITDFAKAGESIELMERKLVHFTGEANVLSKVSEVAYRVGIDFEVLNKTLTRFAITTRGAFNADAMIGWTEALVKAGRITGTTTQELRSGLLQLSQAMSAGRLMGDEYRSISENMPLFKQALEDVFAEMGRGTESLKTLSRNGEITTEVLVKGFQKLKMNIVGFGDTWDTIDASMSRVSGQWSLLIFQMTQGNSVFKELVNSVASALKNLRVSLFGTLSDEMEKAVLSGEAFTQVATETGNQVVYLNDELNETKGILASIIPSFLGASDAVAETGGSFEEAENKISILNVSLQLLGGLILGGVIKKVLVGTSSLIGLTKALRMAGILSAATGTTVAVAGAKIGFASKMIMKLKDAFNLAGKAGGSNFVGPMAEAAKVASKMTVVLKYLKVSLLGLIASGFVDGALAMKRWIEQTIIAREEHSKLNRAVKITKEELSALQTTQENLTKAMEMSGVSSDMMRDRMSEYATEVSTSHEEIGKLRKEYSDLETIVKNSDGWNTNRQQMIDAYTAMRELVKRIAELEKSTKKGTAVIIGFGEAIENLNKKARKANQEFKDIDVSIIPEGSKLSKEEKRYNEILDNMVTKFKTARESINKQSAGDVVFTIKNKDGAEEEIRGERAKKEALLSLEKEFIGKHLELTNNIVSATESKSAGTTSTKVKELNKLIVAEKKLSEIKKAGIGGRQLKDAIAEVEKWNGVADKKKEIEEQLVKTKEALVKKNEAYTETLNFELRHLRETNPLIAEYMMNVNQLRIEKEDLTKTEEEYKIALERTQIILKENLEAQKAEEVHELSMAYSEIYAAQNKNTKSVNGLTDAYERGIITLREYKLGVLNARKALVEVKAQTGDLEAVMEKSMYKTTDDMGENMKTTFREVLDGNADAFDNFNERVMNSFKDMLADMIYEAFINPIILDVQSSMSGGASGGASGAGGSILGSILGGGGGSASMDMPDNLGGSSGGMLGGIGSFFTGLFSANGNVFNQGQNIQAFASGGVVSSPTLFPMAGGAGLMGEAGAEAIIPLKRGKNGKLGVASTGGGEQNITININVSGTQGDPEAVRRSAGQVAQAAGNATQRAMRRNG